MTINMEMIDDEYEYDDNIRDGDRVIRMDDELVDTDIVVDTDTENVGARELSTVWFGLHNIVEVDEVVVENLEIENLEAVVSCQPGDTAKGYSNNEKSNLDVVEDPFDDDDDSGQSIRPPDDSSSESEDKEHSSPITKGRNNAGVHPRDIEASSSTISSTSSDEEWDVDEEDLFDVDHYNQQHVWRWVVMLLGLEIVDMKMLCSARRFLQHIMELLGLWFWRYCRGGRWYEM